MVSAFNGLSVIVWSLIAAKAKTGLNAATNGESKSVGQSLKQVGAMILMIALASGFNIYASQTDLKLEVPEAAVEMTAQAGVKMLQAGREAKETLDTHYGGGVAAFAFE